LTAKLLTTNPERFITATLVGSSGQRGWTDRSARGMEAQAKELESSSVPYRTMVLVTTGLDDPTPTERAIRDGSATHRGSRGIVMRPEFPASVRTFIADAGSRPR
jgi:hypothetical protein